MSGVDPYVRHAVLFGPEFVVETAFPDPESEGASRLRAAIALALRQGGKQSVQKRRRPTTTALRTQVLELHERGLIEAAIADTLNISDRRVQVT